MAEKLALEKCHAFMHNGQKVFEWDQTLEVNMYIELPKGVPTKLFRCTIQAGHVEVSIRGNPPYLNHDLTYPVKTDTSFWTIDRNGASDDQNKKGGMDQTGAKKMSTEDCNRTEPQRPVNPFAKSSSSKEQSPSLLDSIKKMNVETEKVEKPNSKKVKV